MLKCMNTNVFCAAPGQFSLLSVQCCVILNFSNNIKFKVRKLNLVTINQKPTAVNVPVDVESCNQNHLNALVKALPLKKGFKFRFDFDIGFLVKSPCRNCRNDMNLPECADKCTVLEKIQTILSESVSCTRRF